MIVVVGSLNVDYVVAVPRQPGPGETLMGSDYKRHLGGKGANQAVAAARVGAEVRMVGCVGTDADGDALRRALVSDHIDIGGLQRVEGPSGAAFITVDPSGQNAIVVAPGANGLLVSDDIAPALLEGARVVVLQLEIPQPVVRAAMRLGREAGAVVLLNAAPMRGLEPVDLTDASLLVVNESEAGLFAGRPAPRSPAETLAMAATMRSRVPAVVITLGEQGSVWSDGKGSFHTKAFAVNPVDTTGAGDAFVGALAASLADGLTPQGAMHFASATGALATTRPGAQEAMPHRGDVLALIAGR